MQLIKSIAWLSFAAFFGLLTFVLYNETQTTAAPKKYVEIVTIVYADGRKNETKRLEEPHDTEADCLMTQQSLDELSANNPNISRFELTCAVATPE